MGEVFGQELLMTSSSFMESVPELWSLSSEKLKNWLWIHNLSSKQFVENFQSTWLRLTMLLQPLFLFPLRWVYPFSLKLACHLSFLLKDTSLLNALKPCHPLSLVSSTSFPLLSLAMLELSAPLLRKLLLQVSTRNGL